MPEHELHVPPGHYYSPIPNKEDIEYAKDRRGNTNLGGIELDPLHQMKIAHDWIDLYPQVLHWLSSQTEKYTFDNTWFFGSDAISLSLMLVSQPPRNIIEVGSGYSTALIEDINQYWFNNEISIFSVDPNSERARSLNLSTEILETKVQEVSFDVFANLGDKDVLLIDSSHVLKAGSDVHFLFNHVLPHLAPGVKIHIHDIFYPFEYPSSWLDEHIAFNEAYALELLLRNSTKFKILYWNNYLESTQREWFETNMPETLSSDYATGGIWLQVL